MSEPEMIGCPSLTFEVEGHVAVVTLNRPDVGHALNGEMAEAMVRIWQEVRVNEGIRAVVITATGERHFCTGADVSRLNTDGETSLKNLPIEQVVRWSAHQNRIWKPVIVAVNGLVNGAGLHLVVDSDIIVASENAVFMDTHVNVGQVGAIENIGLAKRLPLGTALRMTLQGKAFRLDAERAHQLGLADELVPADALMRTAMSIARDIAANSPQAVALSKEAIWKSLDLGYTQSVEYGWGLIRIQWGHPDFEEGPKAFGEKRTPEWTPDPNARR